MLQACQHAGDSNKATSTGGNITLLWLIKAFFLHFVTLCFFSCKLISSYLLTVLQIGGLPVSQENKF